MAGRSADWRVAFVGDGCAAPRDFGGDGDAKLAFKSVRKKDAFFAANSFSKIAKFYSGQRAI